MRREIYETLEYHSPDGKVYRFDSGDKFIISETGFGMPPIEYITQRSPLQHGNTVVDYRLQPRVIQIVHRRNACSRMDYWSNRSELGDFLRPNRSIYSNKSQMPIIAPGKLVKTLPNNRRVAIDVFIEQGPEFAAREASRWDEWSFTETLRFIAPDPVWYDMEDESHVYTLAKDNQLVFPFDFPLRFDLPYIDRTENITYNGTWHTYPIITVKGPASGFEITNKTTRELLYYTATISEGETVVLDLRFGVKTITSDKNGNMLSAISPLSDFATFHIAPNPEAPNGVNAIRIYVPGGSSNTTLEIKWKTKYILI